MTIILEHPQALINIEELPKQKRKISVELLEPSLFVARFNIKTSYSIELIESILKLKGVGYLCDEIARDENQYYTKIPLKYLILGHVKPEDLKNKRLLDFGCGCGASTVILARMFPDTEIVGIELNSKSLELAKLRVKHYQLDNVQFLLSPNSNRLPENIGKFDFILLNAVFEHFLPNERLTVLPQLWSLLNSQGIMFFRETPHRYSPIENHTTDLPLINYLPDSLALFCARRFSKRIEPNATWESLLRRGIRGGTEAEIINIIKEKSHEEPSLLEPNRLDLKDRIDLKYAGLSSLSLKSKIIKALLKTIKLLTGYTFVSWISLAIKKP
ncbi:class I SAM-dependent methyltransferase [Okeania sp. KiyG1]|uniref:class I SAM-dependent methyltransferase n=1 Tax=Okeania sp. KiyG1 TaxID=2720165 RepID=UPI0019216B70|nr:class I SAM-dependent methyltransferase [Okeania sp. KiyG1]GGA36689.1 hypothetical protein CYANOKiyG1_54640 [Okeania sp. KiyG1]